MALEISVEVVAYVLLIFSMAYKVIYIQDSVSWILGFALRTGFMVFSIKLFFVSMSIYVFIKP